MNNVVKKKWLTALESGKYNHGTSKLKTIGIDKKVYHCCLGVLCELAIEEGICEEMPNNDELAESYVRFKDSLRSYNTLTLPQDVAKWANITESGEFLRRRVSGFSNLIGINDSNNDYKKVIKAIKTSDLKPFKGKNAP